MIKETSEDPDNYRPNIVRTVIYITKLVEMVGRKWLVLNRDEIANLVKDSFQS